MLFSLLLTAVFNARSFPVLQSHCISAGDIYIYV